MPENSTVMESQRSDQRFCFEAYRPLVDSICRRHLRSRHDIEDAMQDTFVKMISHGMGPTCARLPGWLSAAAYTSCIDQIRRSGSEQRRRLGWSRAHPGFEGDSSAHEERCHRVEQALLQLDEPSRELLVERFYRRTPLRVIARRSGVSVSTVSRWGTNALRALAGVLREMNLN